MKYVNTNQHVFVLDEKRLTCAAQLIFWVTCYYSYSYSYFPDGAEIYSKVIYDILVFMITFSANSPDVELA